MRVGCVYSIENYVSIDKPMRSPMEIPFGISIIATVLKVAKHDVDLFVFSPVTSVRKILEDYIREKKPQLFCLSAVSSQFPPIENVAALIKEIDPDIFIVLGGHHASLSPDQAIKCINLDAICVSEGDAAVVELARQLGEDKWPSAISNLWIRHPETGDIEKNSTAPFNEDLDTIPHVDRTLWEPWITNPHEEASVLVGRGCPYKCTYCSNHAMEELAEGKYVRYRSPEDMIMEIDTLTKQYPRMNHIYLEIETVGADILKGINLFEKLANYNNRREEKLSFRINLALHSNFVRSEEKYIKFLELCEKANVTALNVGLESGSERVRRQILKRPRYTNEELIRFCRAAREFGVATSLLVLMGVPGETFEDYLETVRVVRDLQPEDVQLSVFYPYLGTDLYNVAVEQGVIPTGGTEPSNERHRATLELPDFPKWRVQFEFIYFWFRSFKGYWPIDRIFLKMLRAFLLRFTNLSAIARYLIVNNRFCNYLFKTYMDGAKRVAGMKEERIGKMASYHTGEL